MRLATRHMSISGIMPERESALSPRVIFSYHRLDELTGHPTHLLTHPVEPNCCERGRTRPVKFRPPSRPYRLEDARTGDPRVSGIQPDLTATAHPSPTA